MPVPWGPSLREPLSLSNFHESVQGLRGNRPPGWCVGGAGFRLGWLPLCGPVFLLHGSHFPFKSLFGNNGGFTGSWKNSAEGSLRPFSPMGWGAGRYALASNPGNGHQYHPQTALRFLTEMYSSVRVSFYSILAGAHLGNHHHQSGSGTVSPSLEGAPFIVPPIRPHPLPRPRSSLYPEGCWLRAWGWGGGG